MPVPGIKNIGETDFHAEAPCGDLERNNGGAAEYRHHRGCLLATTGAGRLFRHLRQASPNCDHQGALTNTIQNGPTDARFGLHGQRADRHGQLWWQCSGYTEGTGTDAQDTNDQDGISLCRLPDGVDTDNNNADFVLGCPTRCS